MTKRHPVGLAARAAVAALCVGAVSGAAQTPPDATWTLRVLDHSSGGPLGGVLVAFPEHSVQRTTNDAGIVEAAGADALTRIVATRLGYADLDTLVAFPGEGGTVEVSMERAAMALAPLTVQASREMTSRRLHRMIFDREVAVGAIGVTREDIEAVPAVAEADVFRSVQATAGVTSVSDFTGELFVRGGDSDQVSVLYDGAPVFGPYHLFGLFGTFNADAIDYAEFYKGSFPARYGGSLSGVLAARPRTGGDSRARFRGGVSLLGVRAVADGTLPWKDMRWVAGARKASVDVARIGLPYSFQDFNVGLQAYPSENHRLRFSFLASQDHYAWTFDSGDSPTLDAGWANVVSSATWEWVGGGERSASVNAYHSYYDASLALGASDLAPTTVNRISAFGLRAGATRRGERIGGRAGVSVEGGPVDLGGLSRGAFFEADASRSYLHGSAFAESELWLGRLRLAPGVRAGIESKSSRFFAEPRLSVRYRSDSFAVSASLDQTYQFLSVLRDALTYAPGAPMWFVRDEDDPMTWARGASLSIDAWRGDDWTGSVTGWGRRFRSVPYWRPIFHRDLSVLDFHDGSAHGVDVVLQKHAGRFVRGWLAYQWAWTALQNPGKGEYSPRWDRRHELDATVVFELRGLTASFRGTVGTGTPFWMPAGRYYGRFFDPRATFNRISQRLRVPSPFASAHLDFFTIWSDVQGRIPLYARFDGSVRYAFERESWSIIPYASVVNMANRHNVLNYTGIGSRYRAPDGTRLSEPVPELSPTVQLPIVPFLGIDFRIEGF